MDMEIDPASASFRGGLQSEMRETAITLLKGDYWNQSKQDIMSHDGNGILSLNKHETQCGQTLSIMNLKLGFPAWKVSGHD